MSSVRTRFAPSPTGYLHVGGVRTALFAWLVAKHFGGKFILRFEDTDQKREVEGAKTHLIRSLSILGINHDEGPDIGGAYAPYVQSQRLASYKKWAHKLIEAGRAYADPFSPEEVQAFRKETQKQKKPFLYRNYRPSETKPWDGSAPLRFKSEPKAYEWHDEVMGELSSVPEVIDDFVLIKSDGYPTYNFAHIIDDYEMHISHVLRGQEFLSSVPNYLNLYEALDIKPPIFATMPHVMGPDGQKKLSKRDGARDVLEFIDMGYLPEALVSFIATLGWNDGTEQEIFNTAELISKFTLDRVQRSGAHFDEKRLNWLNGSLIRQMDIHDLLSKTSSYWPRQAQDYDDNYKEKVLSLFQERLKYLSELSELSEYFFKDLPIDLSLISTNKQLSKLAKEELIHLLNAALNKLEDSSFSNNDLVAQLNELLEATKQKPAVLFSLIRIAISQAPSSPALSETMAVLGKEKVIRRIGKQITALSELDR